MGSNTKRVTTEHWNNTFNNLTGLGIKMKSLEPTLPEEDESLLGKRLRKDLNDEEENIVSKVITEEPADDMIKFEEN